MKIKNVFLASLLTKLGHEVKAELVVDDANGTSLTFPDISDVAEIAEGVAVDAPDGTYVVANGEDALTIVCEGGLVMSVTTETPEAEAEATEQELDAEVAAVLSAVSDEVVGLKASLASVTAELKGLKASLKHDTPDEKKKPEAGKGGQFKLVD